MFQVGTDWNPLQSRLKEIITKKEHFEEMKQLVLKMHSLIHSSTVYGGTTTTYMDEVWDGLDDLAFRTMPTIKDDTVAWDIWHITRIEDLTSNYLMQERDQVLDSQWLQRLNTSVADTGNSMTDEEIIAFSNQVNKDSLYEYRNAVGQRTRSIVEGLGPEEMKRRVSQEGISRIAKAGGVANHPDAIWLLDFWGRKTVAGIIQMPITRHQIVHLNDCRRLKEVCKKMK